LKLTHRCAQASINLEDSELVQVFVVELGGKLVIRDDLVRGRGFDQVPVAEEENQRVVYGVCLGFTGVHSWIFRPDIE